MCTIHCSLYGSLYLYNSLYTVWISVCVQYTVDCTDICMSIHCTLNESLYLYNSFYTVQISVCFSLYGKVGKKHQNHDNVQLIFTAQKVDCTDHFAL